MKCNIADNKKNEKTCYYCKNTGIIDDHRVYVYVAKNTTWYPHIGSFNPIAFSVNDNEKRLTDLGFTRTHKRNIGCYILIDADFTDKWDKANKVTFSVVNERDLEQVKKWYEKQRRVSYCKISPFFIV